jgi:CubicO group peptidase (beta-lactamase class C family)
MRTNRNEITAVTAGVLVTGAVTLLALLAVRFLWPEAGAWVWLALLTVGSLAGGGTAAWLAQSQTLRPGILVGLIAGLLALATAVITSDFAPRTTLAGVAYLIGGTAGAALGVAIVRQRLSRAVQDTSGFFFLLGIIVLSAGLARADAGPHDTTGLEQFLDQAIVVQLVQLDIPGAAVAVVGDGQLLLAKGYGLADQAQDHPVDGGRTLFRIGSAGKLITWTAVLQLVEQERLDLHADVNSYLDFTIPATFPEPIAYWNLLA